MIKGSENGLLKKYNDTLSMNKKYRKPNKFNTSHFIVCHYAGEVEYEIGGFLEKNKDTINEIITETLAKSGCGLICELFENAPV